MTLNSCVSFLLAILSHHSTWVYEIFYWNVLPLCSSKFFSFPKAKLRLCFALSVPSNCSIFFCLLLIWGLHLFSRPGLFSITHQVSLDNTVVTCYCFVVFAVVGIESRLTTLPLKYIPSTGYFSYIIFPIIFKLCVSFKKHQCLMSCWCIWNTSFLNRVPNSHVLYTRRNILFLCTFFL